MFGLGSFGSGFSGALQSVTRDSSSLFNFFPSSFGNFGAFGGLFGGGGGGSTKFPFDLDESMYLIIRVYDNTLAGQRGFALSEQIVNAITGFGESARETGANVYGGNAIKDATQAFEGAGGGAGGGTGGSFGGGIGNVTGSVGKGTGGIISTISSIGSNFFSQMGAALSGFQGFGNAKLPRVWKANIYLPLPNTLTESLSHRYNEEKGWLFYMPFGKTLEGAVTAAAAFSANVAKLTGGQYVRYNQNKIMMYDSTNFRDITLTWHLVPNNQAESQTLYELIRLLKMFSSAGTAAGKLLLTSPYYFALEFQNKVINDALRFNETVLTNINVTYSPGGMMELYHDQSPKSVELSLVFKDREPKVREDWAKNPAGGGMPMPESGCDTSGGDSKGNASSSAKGGVPSGTSTGTSSSLSQSYYGRDYNTSGGEWGGV